VVIEDLGIEIPATTVVVARLQGVFVEFDA
jgi:hypothetical protein